MAYQQYPQSTTKNFHGMMYLFFLQCYHRRNSQCMGAQYYDIIPQKKITIITNYLPIALGCIMCELFTSILTPQQINKDHMRFPQRLPNIITQLPQDAFGVDAFSILPRYATILSEQLTQTRKNPSPLGDIYQVKHVANKYDRVEHLPLLKYQACSKSTTIKISYILKKNFKIHLHSINTISPLKKSSLYEDQYKSPFYSNLTPTKDPTKKNLNKLATSNITAVPQI